MNFNRPNKRGRGRVFQLAGFTALLLAIGAPLVAMGGSEARVWPIMQRITGSQCLDRVGLDLREIRPGNNQVFMVQRGLGWNDSDDFVSLTIDVQYTGEFAMEGAGRTEQVNKSSQLNVGFEPHSKGRFESVVGSVFRRPPRPGWDIEAVVIPGTARCMVWSERPASFKENGRDIVLRSGE